MPLPPLLEWVVRRLAGSGDAESMLADLEIEAADRQRRSDTSAARRWLWSEVARSSPVLVGRRISRAIRVVRGGRTVWFRGMGMDVRLAARRLRRSPVFTALAICTLGLGLGATTSVFALAYTIWLKPLPYGDPERLVSIVGLRAGSSGAGLDEIRAGVTSLTGVAGYHYGAFFARFDGEPIRLVADPVSTNLFAVLGAAPALGRTFTPNDFGTPNVVLSDALWRTRFHADPGVIGRTIAGADQTLTIIGVMPQGFRFPLGLEADLWRAGIPRTDDRTGWMTEVVARLAPGTTPERAQSELSTFSGTLARLPQSNAAWSLELEPVAGQPSVAYREAFGALLGIVGLFLAISSINLASLLIVRNLARRVELTVTMAIGGSRSRLVRGLLAESAFIALIGGALAVGVTWEAMQAFRLWLPPATPRLADLRLTGDVLAFAAGAAGITGLLCTIAPIVGLRTLRLSESISGTREVPTARTSQHTLVVVEIALAVVLVVCASTMVGSFRDLLARDRGYVPSGVTTMTLALPFAGGRYVEPAFRVEAVAAILANVASVPGVTVVGGVTGFPGSPLGILGSGPVTVPGRTAPPIVAALHAATPDYFRAMGVALVRGRFFTPNDDAGHPPVAIVNESLARQLGLDDRSLGRYLAAPAASELSTILVPDTRIIGVVADMHLGVQRSADIFAPFAQVPSFWFDLVARSLSEPAAVMPRIQTAIRRANSDALVEHVSTMERVISDVYGLQRAQSTLTALVACFSGLIALLGLYALLTQYVARRRRELGIRLALGSSPSRLFWQVFQRGVILAAVGTGLGVGMALLVMRILRDEIFGVRITSGWFLAAIAAGIIASCASVTAVSARRVIGIDPIGTLRDV